MRFNNTIENIESSINLNLDSVTNIFDSVSSAPVEDKKINYNIPGLGLTELTVFDSSFLKDGVDFFRPLIRGFIILSLIFYNYSQLLTFLGQDPNIAHNAHEDYKIDRMKKSGRFLGGGDK